MSHPGSLAANAPAGPGLAECFAEILGGLCDAAASRAGRYRFIAPYVLLLWPYLRRLTGRFDRLVARWQAGRLATPARRAVHLAEPAKRPRPPALPRGFGWVLQLVPSHAAERRSQLLALLDQPDMAALLAASPQAGRLLRPLCHMLGIPPAEQPPALLPTRRAPACTAVLVSADPPDGQQPPPPPDGPMPSQPASRPDGGFVAA